MSMKVNPRVLGLVMEPELVNIGNTDKCDIRDKYSILVENPKDNNKYYIHLTTETYRDDWGDIVDGGAIKIEKADEEKPLTHVPLKDTYIENFVIDPETGRHCLYFPLSDDDYIELRDDVENDFADIKPNEASYDMDDEYGHEAYQQQRELWDETVSSMADDRADEREVVWEPSIIENNVFTKPYGGYGSEFGVSVGRATVNMDLFKAEPHFSEQYKKKLSKLRIEKNKRQERAKATPKAKLSDAEMLRMRAKGMERK